MSGTVLGPPNYHDYQNQLRKLHAERFSRLPFEAFKARVKIVKDEAVVKKWIEDHSFKTEYNCLNVPESLKLASREEVEKHFRQVHMSNLVKSVDFHVVSGLAARQLRSPGLQRSWRAASATLCACSGAELSSVRHASGAAATSHRAAACGVDAFRRGALTVLN